MSRISLIAILCFFGAIVRGQGSKDAFYRAIDYCDCKLAYVYCQKYASSHEGSKEEKSFVLIEEKLKCKIESPLPFDSLNELLKRNNFKSYTEIASPEFKQLKGLSPEGFTKEQALQAIIDHIFSNPKLSSVITTSGFSNQKETLKSDLGKYFEGKFPKDETALNNSASSQNTNDEALKSTIVELQNKVSELQKKIDEKPGPFSPNWLSIIITVVFVVVFFIFFGKRYGELEGRVDRYRDESKLNLPNKTPGQSPTNNISRDWIEFKRNIERTVGDMGDAISRMQNTIAFWDSKVTSKPDTQTTQFNPSKQIREEVFYGSIPNKDGSFNENAISEGINPNESFYRFSIKDSEKASFEFLNDERAAKGASSSPELILYPVCKIKNSPGQNVKRIKTLTPGLVVRRNDKWELDTPAVIEYE